MHHVAHVLDRERIAQEVVAHARTRGVGHLGLLQMEAGLGERAERAGMVVVQVRDDDLLDVAGGNADLLERGGRRPVHLAAALGAFGRVEAGVDDDGALGVADDPDEVVDGVGAVVVVGGDEAFEAPARGQAGIFQGQYLVGIAAHLMCSCNSIAPATMVAKPTSVIMRPGRSALVAMPAGWAASACRLQERSTRRSSEAARSASSSRCIFAAAWFLCGEWPLNPWLQSASWPVE